MTDRDSSSYFSILNVAECYVEEESIPIPITKVISATETAHFTVALVKRGLIQKKSDSFLIEIYQFTGSLNLPELVGIKECDLEGFECFALLAAEVTVINYTKFF